MKLKKTTDSLPNYSYKIFLLRSGSVQKGVENFKNLFQNSSGWFRIGVSKTQPLGQVQPTGLSSGPQGSPLGWHTTYHQLSSLVGCMWSMELYHLGCRTACEAENFMVGWAAAVAFLALRVRWHSPTFQIWPKGLDEFDIPDLEDTAG